MCSAPAENGALSSRGLLRSSLAPWLPRERIPDCPRAGCVCGTEQSLGVSCKDLAPLGSCAPRTRRTDSVPWR